MGGVAFDKRGFFLAGGEYGSDSLLFLCFCNNIGSENNDILISVPDQFLSLPQYVGPLVRTETEHLGQAFTSGDF